MFLNKLSFVEKKAYISLAYLAAEANGKVDDKESLMLEDYCKEMGIAFFDSQNVKTWEEVIRIFSVSEENIKKIVILETIGLMYADGGYDSEERAFTERLSNELGVNAEVVDKIEKLFLKYFDVSKEILDFVNE